MSLDVQEIVSAVATRLNIDNATAASAVGTILSILDHEAAGTKADALFDELPGARDLAQQNDVMAASSGGGGLMGMLGSALGDRAGALINGMAKLKSLGLSVSQIEAAGQQLVDQAKTAAGPDTVNEIINDIPGLAGHLGL
jgi:hypothetical protein